MPAAPGASLTRGLYGTNECPDSPGDRPPFSSAVAAPASGPCGSDPDIATTQVTAM